MKTIISSKTHYDSFSFSRRYFTWKNKSEEEDEEDEIPAADPSRSQDQTKSQPPKTHNPSRTPRKKLSVMAVSKLKSALARARISSGLGPRLVGTLFGHRRGHVHFAFQEDPRQAPAILVQLATPTSLLVREMASGLVRIALECDRKGEKKNSRLIEEPMWRAYCNGKKCGYAVKKECGPEEWKVLEKIGQVSMGAGVLPGGGEMGEMMYMRGKFERVVGNRDSEAFYMMNPDGGFHGGPELSIYFLRV